MADTYLTVAYRSQHEIKVHGSRFLAEVFPLDRLDHVQETLDSVRKALHDATHHCFAYRLGSSGELYRAYDDGEPGGSAGRPILAAIDRPGLTNVLVIVTRYFGGTKLGVGGLARAYGEAADGALKSAGKRTCYLMAHCTVRFAHAHISAVMRTVSRLQATIVDTQYDEQVLMRIEIRRSMVDRLRAELVESTSGQLLLDPP